MALNLVSLVSQYLTPDIISRIAAALGLSRGNTQTAVGAAVPAILAGLVGVAEQPGGAEKLADAARQQFHTLEDVAGLIGGQGQSSLIQNGTSMLSSIFGGHTSSALSSAVGQFAGTGSGASQSLLGMLTPLVMGVLGKQQSSASGIASLLTSQKDNIASALPFGFSDLLSGTGILSSLGDSVRSAVGAGTQTVRTAAYQAGSAVSSAASSARESISAARAPTMPNWLYWAIPLIALTALVIYFFGSPTGRMFDRASAVADLTVDRVDVGKTAVESIAGLRSTLAGIVDAKTANEALPELNVFATQMNAASDRVPKLTQEQRQKVAELVNPEMPSLNRSFERVLAVPGATDDLKPTIDSIKADLAALGG